MESPGEVGAWSWLVNRPSSPSPSAVKLIVGLLYKLTITWIPGIKWYFSSTESEWKPQHKLLTKWWNQKEKEASNFSSCIAPRNVFWKTGPDYETPEVQHGTVFRRPASSGLIFLLKVIFARFIHTFSWKNTRQQTHYWVMFQCIPGSDAFKLYTMVKVTLGSMPVIKGRKREDR